LICGFFFFLNELRTGSLNFVQFENISRLGSFVKFIQKMNIHKKLKKVLV